MPPRSPQQARPALSLGRGAGALTEAQSAFAVLVDDAFVAQMKMGELSIAVFQIQLDGPGGLCGATADFRDAELEAVRQFDAHAVLGPGDRIADRLTDRLQQSG